MGAMSTSLVQRSDASNQREWTAPAHTLAVPFIVKQKRSTPPASTGRATDSITFIRGGVDTGSVAVTMPATVRLEFTRQANMSSADISALVALVREVVASTNFDNLVAGQAYLQ